MYHHAGRRSLPAAIALAIAAITWVATQPATSSAHAAHRQAQAPSAAGQAHDLDRARAATRRFRDLDAAKAAGYTATTGTCAQDPKYGGMGIHYANPDLVADGKLDVTRPEVLVYQPMRGGELRLGAVEYFQADGDQNLATDPDRPSLFDLPFDGPMLGHEPGMPIHYDLHVWLYRHNPAGRFAAWNPDVHCPRTAPHDVAARTARAPQARTSQKIPGPPKALGQNCGDVDYSDRTQAYHNRAGVVFQPRGDTFKVWDNRRDNRLVSVWFNYAGAADKWKYVGTPSDGGQGPIVRNVDERYRNICFAIVTGDRDFRQSPIVRYTTRP